MSVPVDPQSEREGYEHHDARVRNLLFIGLAILCALLLSGVTVAGLIWYLDSREQAYVTPLEASSQQPPEPRLEAYPPANGERIVSQAQQRLARYGWVDREGGLAQIPIERAMSIIAAEGWPSTRSSDIEAGPREIRTYRRATQ